MKFARLNGKKVEATPGARGVCRICGSELIAKCGEYKVWHWAHKAITDCDSWHEPETWWHRNWKNCFPIEWQEVFHTDSSTSEKHIADIKTPFGRVIEFQHSPIKPEERVARENFYKKMFWIVDGNRAPTNIDCFKSGLNKIDQEKALYRVKWGGASRLLDSWGKSQVKVLIDFGDHLLWELIEFDHSKRIGTVKCYNKDSFFKYINRTTKDFCFRQAENGILEIMPGISIGPYMLGMPKQEVWDKFRYPITCFYKTKESIHRSDHIEDLGIDIHYDDNEKCILIEAWTQIKNKKTIVKIGDVTLNGQTMGDVKILCDKLPYSFQKHDYGFESMDKRIGFHCYEYESEDSLLDGVFIMRPQKISNP